MTMTKSKMIKIIIGVVVAVVVLGIGQFWQTVPTDSEKKIVQMKTQDGTDMGTITLSETRAGVLLSLDLNGLKPDGEHAIHIHEVGVCDGDFSSAGGHYNPTDHSHGLKHPEGSHAGDMPNIKPDDQGVIQSQILNQKITLAKESVNDRATVFDDNGSVIIIHQDADDHMSQPSGAAGPRIACGVIE